MNHINIALDKYNNRVHGTTKTAPFEISSNNNTAIPNLIPTPKFPKFPNFPKFQVGDFVRAPDKCSVYNKGYTTNWKRELFKIYIIFLKINSTNPVIYTLEDENKEIILEKYYDRELLRSAFIFKSNNKTLEVMSISHKFEYFFNRIGFNVFFKK